MKRLAAVLVAVPLLLTGCVAPYGGEDLRGTATAIPGNDFSRLDPAGIEQIKDSKAARLDMASGRLTKEGVGLQDGTSQAPDVVIRDGEMDDLRYDGSKGIQVIIVHVSPLS